MKSPNTSHIDNRPIGVFDSGLGGLTVVAALARRLPDEEIIYLGDTARVPYGDKSEDSIIRYSHQDIDFLLRRGVKLCIAACNTVSAVAMSELHESLPQQHIIGVIEAGVRAALQSGARSIAVIATRATINSDAYRRGIHAFDRSIRVESLACPLLVPLAEEGLHSGPITAGVLDLYLAGLKQNPPDALLLGCTHYPLLRDAIDEYFSGRVRIIDSASSCADFVADYLEQHKLHAAQGRQHPRQSFFVTDLPAAFHLHASRFLGCAPGQVEKVRLEGL